MANIGRNWLVPGVLLASLLAAADARAQTATTTISVSATVIAACTVTALPLAFGNVSLISGAVIDVTVTGGITPVCSMDAPYHVGLNAGVGSGATVAIRKMTGTPSGTLNYTIYSTGTTVWGNTSGDGWVAKTGTGAADPTTYYGRILASQLSPVGSYTDTVTVTVTF